MHQLKLGQSIFFQIFVLTFVKSNIYVCVILKRVHLIALLFLRFNFLFCQQTYFLTTYYFTNVLLLQFCNILYSFKIKNLQLNCLLCNQFYLPFTLSSNTFTRLYIIPQYKTLKIIPNQIKLSQTKMIYSILGSRDQKTIILSIKLSKVSIVTIV